MYIWKIIKVYYKKYNCLKFHLHEKFIFKQKNVQSFFKIMPLAHLILFAPKFYVVEAYVIFIIFIYIYISLNPS